MFFVGSSLALSTFSLVVQLFSLVWSGTTKYNAPLSYQHCTAAALATCKAPTLGLPAGSLGGPVIVVDVLVSDLSSKETTYLPSQPDSYSAPR
ncbi:uncharacterized protein RSE6_10428 [Rhynchosporium secalis]|uniref:Secreted protein n=1 Tax=Rhynchosporium secalis TaxID=38038 RepID=A0A1E1MKG5_RHYSE|nr:uncharacterized protein RSE6_10428 [Rhynchosporium secalis]